MNQMNTWHFYRSTLVPMQLFTLGACAFFYFGMRAPWLAVVALFVVMQLGLLLGATWGASLHRRRLRREEMLPLQRRRPPD